MYADEVRLGRAGGGAGVGVLAEAVGGDGAVCGGEEQPRHTAGGRLPLYPVWRQASGVGVPDGPQRSARHSRALGGAHTACSTGVSKRRGHPSKHGGEPNNNAAQ